MRAKQVVGCMLLVATVGASGCMKERDLVGRWETGSSNYYFREDGILFYRSSSGAKYQGRYRYDDSTQPGTVRAELQPSNEGDDPISLELCVTFLSPTSIRLELPGGKSNRTVIALRK
jgi:hypothetical protein